MATPRLQTFTLPGALGPILVDVRSGDASPRPAVIVIHGFKGFKDWGMFPPFADRLARAGFSAVSFNTSGSGVDTEGEFRFPDRFGHNTFSAELEDVQTVLAALDQAALGVPRPTSVGMVGHSRGGGVAILTAAATPRIGALVTWAAISTVQRWGPGLRAKWRAEGRLDITNSRTGQVLPVFTDVLDEVERAGEQHGGPLDIAAAAVVIRIPWLLVHGLADETVPIAEGERLVAVAARSAEFLQVDGTGHTFGAVHPFAGRTPALDRVFDATTSFLGKHLG